MEPAWEKVQGLKFALSSRTIEHVWEKVSQGKISQSSRMVVQPNSGVRELPSYIRIRTECLLHRNELSVRSFGQGKLGTMFLLCMRDIRKMEIAWENVTGSKFGLCEKSYLLANGVTKKQPFYQLTKTECLYIATKFNDEARAKLVLRWEELEMRGLPSPFFASKASQAPSAL